MTKHGNTTTQRSKGLLTRFRDWIKRPASVRQTLPSSTLRGQELLKSQELLERYQLHGSDLPTLQDRIDQSQCPHEIEDLSLVKAVLLDLLAQQKKSINEDWEHGTIPTFSRLEGSIEGGESFPMEVFMDYAEPTYTFSVGDIVWAKRLEGQPDDLPDLFEAVVVSRIIDLDLVLYTVAPYNTQLTECTPIPMEYGEDELFAEHPDPAYRRRHLAPV